MKKLVCALLSVQIFFATAVMNPASAVDDDILKSTQNDLILVAAAGAGGAILGLSTLSFVDKPSKHVSNIWTGAAIGIIAGVVFVAYQSAQRGSEDLQSDEASIYFNSSERYAWHAQQSEKLTTPKVQFGTQIFQLSY